MAEQLPPVWLDAESHTAEDLRRVTWWLTGGRPGVFGDGSLLVTENDTPDLQVKVAGGAALVAGDGTYQGTYFVENRGDELVTVSVGPSAGNERWDLVVLRVQDLDAGDAANTWAIEIVEGTAAAIGSALFPALPASGSYLVVAAILVPATVTAITDSMITDIRDASISDGTTTLRNRGRAAAAGGIIPIESSSSRPLSPEPGTAVWQANDGAVWIADDAGVFQFLANRDYGRHTTWTPTVTGFSFDSGLVATFARVGDHVHCTLIGTLDAVPTGDLTISNPVQAHADFRDVVGLGPVQGVDVDLTLRYAGTVGIVASGDDAKVWPTSAGGESTANPWNATVPQTWEIGDTVTAQWTYRAVSL